MTLAKAAIKAAKAMVFAFIRLTQPISVTIKKFCNTTLICFPIFIIPIVIPMTSTKGVTRFSVSLPPALVDDFDEAWKNMGYENRSKAAHDAFRAFITETKFTREESEEIAGTVTLLYYLDKPGLLNQIVLRFKSFVTLYLYAFPFLLSQS